MSIVLLAALLAAWLVGALIVAALWPREHPLQADLPLILPLGAIIGVGTTSGMFFVASLISDDPAFCSGVIELVGAVALITYVWRRRMPPPFQPPAAVAWSWLQWLAASLFLQAVAVTAIIAWRAFAAEPYGGWDGWAIWNMHARFMLRAGTAWPELLAAPQLSWTHPDYPRLLPASVARAWSWIGAEPPLAGAVISLLFAAATVALLVAAIARMRGAVHAFVAGLLLLGTPFFVTFASNQHADIPLGSFMLAAALLVVSAGNTASSRGMCALAGLCTGLAAWTKNEGMLFAVVFAAVFCVHEWRRNSHSRRNVGGFIGALVVTLLPVLYFKFFLAPANDLTSAPLGPRMAQLSDLARHRLILSSWWRDVRGFGEWRVVPYLAMALPFAAWRWRRRLVGSERLIPVLIGLMLTGYYGVYLVSPHDLTWHLNTSLVRLFIQVWPLVVLGWGLMLPAPPMPATDARERCWPWWPFAAVNLLILGGLVALLFTQLAANELAVRRIGPAETSALLGDGWYGREQYESSLWAWSAGRATLHLRVNSTRSTGPLTLRFALRSLGPRTITVRTGGRVLWQAALGDQFAPVEITGLDLPPGTTTIEFTSDSPGIAESPASGARSLAFALYNLRLD